LNRRKVCQGRDEDPCVIKHWLGGEEIREFPGGDGGVDDSEGEEMKMRDL